MEKGVGLAAGGLIARDLLACWAEAECCCITERRKPECGTRAGLSEGFCVLCHVRQMTLLCCAGRSLLLPRSVTSAPAHLLRY